MLQQLTFLCDRVSIIEKRMGFRPRKVSVRKKKADRVRTESIHAAGDRDGEDRTRLTEEKATKMEDEMATEAKALNGTDDMTEADPKAESTTNDMSGEEAEALAGSSAGATEEDNEIETETETKTEARGQAVEEEANEAAKSNSDARQSNEMADADDDVQDVVSVDVSIVRQSASDHEKSASSSSSLPLSDFKSEDVSFLDLETARSLSPSFQPRDLFLEIARVVHFNKGRPHYTNVYIPDSESSYGLLREGGRWNIWSKERILSFFIDTTAIRLDAIRDMMCAEKMKKERKTIGNFLLTVDSVMKDQTLSLIVDHSRLVEEAHEEVQALLASATFDEDMQTIFSDTSLPGSPTSWAGE